MKFEDTCVNKAFIKYRYVNLKAMAYYVDLCKLHVKFLHN